MTVEEKSGTQENWRLKVLIIGGIVGVLTGLGAAYLLIKRAEREDTTPQLGAGEGVKLGLLVLGLLKQVASLGEGK